MNNPERSQAGCRLSRQDCHNSYGKEQRPRGEPALLTTLSNYSLSGKAATIKLISLLACSVLAFKGEKTKPKAKALLQTTLIYSIFSILYSLFYFYSIFPIVL